MWQNAFAYQKELLTKAEKPNEEAHKRIQELVIQGHTITMTGSITGPYTQSTTYFMSNGESHTIISAASLGWACHGLFF